MLRRWESIAGNLVLTTELKRVKKLTFRALALRHSDWRNCGLCVGYGGQFTFSTQVLTLNYLLYHLTDTERENSSTLKKQCNKKKLIKKAV